MNPMIVKEKIENSIGRKVQIVEYGLRNKKQIYEGTIYKAYPNIFSIMTYNGEKTFSYSDIVTKDIILKYQ